MFGKLLAQVSVALFSAAMGLAQMRASCTGVVRDAEGRPLANAQVVCEWQPDQAVFGTPDRRETKTDDEGRFALDLWIGHAYCTWVIGPAGADKSRLVVPPNWRAVGGRAIELVARVRTIPVRLDVRGTTPWLVDGPLALRVFVATGGALPDLPLPGDGMVTLPPLPTTRFTVALVDGRGQVLDHVITDADAVAACTFSPVTEASFAVVDELGQPVADARIQTTSHWIYHSAPPPLQFWPGSPTARIVATTDAGGRATGRFVRHGSDYESMLFVASGPKGQSVSNPSGWWGRHRVHAGRGAVASDDEPFILAVTPTTSKSVRMDAPDAEFAWHVRFPTQLTWRTRQAAGAFQLDVPGLQQELRTWSNLVPASTTVAQLAGIGSGPLPSRAFVNTTQDTVDPSKLRAIAVRVVDAHGRAVPFAHFGLQRNVKEQPGWLTHLVTDAAGEARICIDVGEPGANVDAYASTDGAHGWVSLKPDADIAQVEVAPFSSTTFRVVDEADRPLAGAFLAASSTSPAAGLPLEAIAQYLVANPVHGAITGADGTVTVKVPKEQLGVHSVTAHYRGRTTIPHSIRSDAAGPIVLRIKK